jgi:hypothetical protein
VPTDFRSSKSGHNSEQEKIIMQCSFVSTLVLSWILVSVSARVGQRHRKLVTAQFGQALTGRYIVVLNGAVGDVLSKAKALLANSGATVEYEYDTAIKGFAVSGLVAKFLTIVLDDDMVEFVEEVSSGKYESVVLALGEHNIANTSLL